MKLKDNNKAMTNSDPELSCSQPSAAGLCPVISSDSAHSMSSAGVVFRNRASLSIGGVHPIIWASDRLSGIPIRTLWLPSQPDEIQSSNKRLHLVIRERSISSLLYNLDIIYICIYLRCFYLLVFHMILYFSIFKWFIISAVSSSYSFPATFLFLMLQFTLSSIINYSLSLS